MRGSGAEMVGRKAVTSAGKYPPEEGTVGSWCRGASVKMLPRGGEVARGESTAAEPSRGEEGGVDGEREIQSGGRGGRFSGTRRGMVDPSPVCTFSTHLSFLDSSRAPVHDVWHCLQLHIDSGWHRAVQGQCLQSTLISTS